MRWHLHAGTKFVWKESGQRTVTWNGIQNTRTLERKKGRFFWLLSQFDSTFLLEILDPFSHDDSEETS